MHLAPDEIISGRKRADRQLLGVRTLSDFGRYYRVDAAGRIFLRRVDREVVLDTILGVLIDDGELNSLARLDHSWREVKAHTHHLEYDYIEECNMDQYISGAGGGALYNLREDHDAEFAIAQYGFLEIEFSSELMKTRFFSIENENIFQRSRKRQPD